MSSTAPLYAKNGADSGRGLSANLWHGLLASYHANDPAFGVRIKDDFTKATTDAITGTTSETDSDGIVGMDAVTAGGTYTVSVIAGTDGYGYLRLDNDGTTADFGVEAEYGLKVIPLPSATSVARGTVCAEFRVDNVDADMHGIMLTDAGLTTPIAGASNAPADVGYIGFLVTEAGALQFMTKSANGGTSDSVEVIAASAYTPTAVHRWGFRVNANPTTLEITVDGVAYPAAAKQISTASLPTGLLAPRIFGTVGNGSTAPTLDLDSLDIFISNAN